MRAWDLDDCEVAIANLKQEIEYLKGYIYELKDRVESLEDEI